MEKNLTLSTVNTFLEILKKKNLVMNDEHALGAVEP